MVKRLERADVGEGFFEPDSARLPSSCSMSMPGPRDRSRHRRTLLLTVLHSTPPRAIFPCPTADRVSAIANVQQCQIESVVRRL